MRNQDQLRSWLISLWVESLPLALKHQGQDVAGITFDLIDSLQSKRSYNFKPCGDLSDLAAQILINMGIKIFSSHDDIFSVLEREYFSNRYIDDEAFLILIIIAVHSLNAFLIRDLGLKIKNLGLVKLAISWLTFARLAFVNDMARSTQLQTRDYVCLAMFLKDEAECRAALGDYLVAVDLRLKSHALNQGDPDFTDLQKWASNEPLCYDVVNLSTANNDRLRTLILKACGLVTEVVDVESNYDYPPHFSPVNTDGLPTFESKINISYTESNQDIIANLKVYNGVMCYTDYWKTAVFEKGGKLIESASSGPYPLISLARKMGLHGQCTNLQGVTAFVAQNHNWSEYYHWLIEIAPRIRFLIEGDVKFHHLVAQGSLKRQYCAEFFQLLGLNHINILGDDSPLAIEADQIIIPARESFLNAHGINFLRQIYLNTIDTSADKKSRIFISRQRANTRRLENYELIENCLISNGFDIITFEEMTVKEQAFIMSNAEIVLAPHGAGLSNIIFCQPEARIIEISAEGCPDVFERISRVLNLQYSAVRAEWRGVNLSIEIDEIVRSIQSVN